MTSLFSWLGMGSFTRISYLVVKYFWKPIFYLILGRICFLGVGGFISNLSGNILTAVILKALLLPFQELFLIAYYNEANNCFNYCIRKYHLVYSFATATAPYLVLTQNWKVFHLQPYGLVWNGPKVYWEHHLKVQILYTYSPKKIVFHVYVSLSFQEFYLGGISP